MNPNIARRRFALGAGAALVSRGRVAWAGESLAAAIAGVTRSPGNVARDKYRHPAALLKFFGLKPTDSVIEIEPGAGYWTEILAPYLKPRGTYRVALPPPPSGATPALAARVARAQLSFLQKLQADPADYGKIMVTGLTDGQPMAPAGCADLVLSFRNLHDWMADGTAASKLALINAALRTGGIFGIEDHRGRTDRPQDPRAKDGYVREDYAADLIEKAGFRLAARSTIGNNPRDTKDYPKGVWTLPPTLAMGSIDRDKYLAIGESDRWTMRFVKSA